MYVFAAGDRRSPAEFGLGAVIIATGPIALAALLLVPDDLSPDDRAAFDAWAASHTLPTALGERPWRVVTLGGHFRPDARVGTPEEQASGAADPTAFYARAYRACSPVVGYDLGHFFGLVGQHFVRRNAEHRDEWAVFLPGCGKLGAKRNVLKVSRHSPPVILTARRAGWRVSFAKAGLLEGKWVRREGYQRPWLGRFVDLAAASYALDADRGGRFTDHRRHFGLAPAELPATVTVAAEGADRVSEAVARVRELSQAVDAEAARWFTSPADRQARVCRLDLATTFSPAGIADRFLRLARVEPPLAHFDLSDEEHRTWAGAFHGGWCSAEPTLLGRPVRVASVDANGCFPLVAHHLGWWELVCAKGVRRVDVADDLQVAADKAAIDPSYLLCPEVFRRFGRTVAMVEPEGCVFPVEVEDPDRPDGRTEWVPVTSSEPQPYCGYNVLASAVLSGRAPIVRSATSCEPEGHQGEIPSGLPLLPGLVLALNEDPVLAYHDRRELAKVRAKEGDQVERRYKAVLHAVFNSMVSGNPSRFDPVWVKQGRCWRRDEVPGPMNFMPLAVSVQAGAHLLLAVLARMVADLGGIIVYRDTDSSFILASLEGGTLPDGRRELSWAEVDGILRAFEPLALPGWPVWKVERGTPEKPLHTVVFGPKRHAEFYQVPGGIELFDFTETNLGGQWEPPPDCPGRRADGHYAWAAEVVGDAVVRSLGRMSPRPDAWAPFPAVRRLAVTARQVLDGTGPVTGRERTDGLPATLGLRPGSRYLAVGADVFGTGEVLAHDPGGDLSGWVGLNWVRRSDGTPVKLVLNREDLPGPGIFHGETLAFQASAWSSVRADKPLGVVHVDERNVRYVGGASPVLDAFVAGEADLGAWRVVGREARSLAFVQAEARRLGPQVFSEVTGISPRSAKRASAGQGISAPNVKRALVALGAPEPRCCPLEGCGREVTSPRAIYCSAAHRDLANKRRRRAASASGR